MDPGSPSSSLAHLYSPDVSTPAQRKRERHLSRHYRPPGSVDGVFFTPSPSPSQMTPSTSHDTMMHHQRSKSRSSLLSLPLFIPKEPSSTSQSSPGTVRTSSQLQHHLLDSPSISPSRRVKLLPSHQPCPPSPRGRLFSTPGMSGPENPPRRDAGSPHLRRWSTTVHGNRSGLAYRLAEGASPYLRAGLDELRSIFDVDSDPIPISALDEDDHNRDEEMDRQRAADITVDLTSPTTEFPPSPTATQVSRTSSLDGGAGMALGLYRAASLTCRTAVKSGSHSQSSSDMSEKSSLRAEDGTMEVGFSAAGLGINRGILAWSLALIAVGLTALCAYGYALHSDTFSTTLIGFFLTQPAFALMGLIALLLRRRALMDLFSRAMRAHVLAQACIVLMAYLDLSASSLYVSSTDSLRRSRRVPFQMMPTMEMRFGPNRGPFEAGDTPGINLLYSKASRPPPDGFAASSGSSIHSHDTHVGDFQSRLTHLIVFIVQAALPIVAILIGQYLVAQRLAWLARRTSASRQNSCSVKNKADRSNPPDIARRSTLPKNLSRYTYNNKTLPSSSLSSERLSSRLAAVDFRSASVSVPGTASSSTTTTTTSSSNSSRPNARPFKHSRSFSQPLDFLSGSHSATEPSPSDLRTSFFPLPLTESPPVED